MLQKIAVPTREEVVDNHFGHCAYYTIYDVEDQKILAQSTLPSLEGCGCKSGIADTLQAMGVSVMLAGNIGQGAYNVLRSHDIEVVRGCSGAVSSVIADYIAGRLHDASELCDHHDCPSHGASADEKPVFKIDLNL